MVAVLMVGLGGFIGAVLRYVVSDAAMKHFRTGFPLGTLIVNALGCLALGALMMVVQERHTLSDNARLFLTTGILGALTTFSTFGHETIELLRAGDSRMALVNVAANLTVGLTAVYVGRMLVRT